MLKIYRKKTNTTLTNEVKDLNSNLNSVDSVLEDQIGSERTHQEGQESLDKKTESEGKRRRKLIIRRRSKS